ncbi:MAG: hypothetical protein DRZ82_03765 [Thermoprotei archaeon]|nr:MAG: hypothetical protein DRZ82_03765 [Thermoprotei archaeon]
MYFVGVDGGATKTLAILSDKQGRILGWGLSGPSNYHQVGVEGAINAINEAVTKAMSMAKVNRVNVMCCGLAGIDTKRDYEIMYKHINSIELAEKKILVHDAIIALMGATAGRPGVVVIAGTGSVAAGMNERGEYTRVGGWGPILGDEGSAYYIAREALAAVLKSYDGREEETMLTSELLKAMNLREVEDIVNKIYVEKVGVTYIASLAPVVTKCASLGDRVALRIIRRAAKELAELIIAVAKKLKMTEYEFSIALVGGVFKAGDLIIKPLYEEVKRVAPKAKIIEPMLPPCAGALIMALREGGIKIEQNVVTNIKNTLKNVPV